VKGKILLVAITLSCFLPDVFQHGLEGNLLKSLGLFEGEERVAKPGMQVPPRKIDELARTVRLISEGGAQAIGECDWTGGNPEFPIHTG